MRRPLQVTPRPGGTVSSPTSGGATGRESQTSARRGLAAAGCFSILRGLVVCLRVHSEVDWWCLDLAFPLAFLLVKLQPQLVLLLLRRAVSTVR